MTQLKLKKPSGFKRAAAAIVDLLISIVSFFILFMFVVQPAFFNWTDYKKVANDYYGALETTGLYEFNEETLYCNIVSFEIKKGEKVDAQRYYDFYDSKVLNYYKESEQLDSYIKLKEDSTLFTVEGTLKENVSQKEIQQFYVHSIQNAVNEIFLKDDVNKKNLNVLQNFSTQMIIASFVPAFVIFYMGMPLLLGHGQTLGKKMFNLRVASTKKGLELPVGTLLLRQFLVIVVGYLAGIFTMLLTPILFMIMFLGQKQGKSLDDLLCSTIVYENVSLDGVDKSSIITIGSIEEKKEEDNEPSLPKLSEEDIIDQSTLEKLNEDNSQEENVK